MQAKMKAMLQKTKVGDSMTQKTDFVPNKNHFRAVPSSKKPALGPPRKTSKQR